MKNRPFESLTSGVVLRSLDEEIALGRRSTSKVLGLIAEVEVRRLFAENYGSLWEFCIKRLRLSEDEASKRINASRAARRFPIIYEMIADGRLHMSGLRMLKPYLTPETANSLIRASIHKTRKEIEQLLADRSPRPDVPTRIVAVPAVAPRIDTPPAPAAPDDFLPAPEPVKYPSKSEVLTVTLATAPPPVTPPGRRDEVQPLGARRYALQVMLKQSTHDKLRRLQELLGHQVPAGDLDAVLERALDAAIEKIEKRKLGATSKPRKAKPSRDPRHIPARVKRAVRERDKDQCAFVGDNGKRCEARHGLEFDHVIPVAKGGESTVANVRQICRAHNQYVAEREFGQDFMNAKRLAAQEARAEHANQGAGISPGAMPTFRPPAASCESRP